MVAAMEQGDEDEENEDNTAGNVEQWSSWPHMRAGLEGLRASDPRIQKQFTKADEKLFDLYGDTIHHNNGTHLNDGIRIAENKNIETLDAGDEGPTFNV